jgi:hypothetical protein
VELLKFAALDEEDLAVVSTHVQDALVKVADIIWQPQDKRLVIALNRFDWETAQPGGQSSVPAYQRRFAALRFERVSSCQCRSVKPQDKEAVLNLLAIEFVPDDVAPGGTVLLTFSGGGALRLHVECLEAELADLGPAWATAVCPEHQARDKTQFA